MSASYRLSSYATLAVLLGTLACASSAHAQNAAMQPSAATNATTSTTAPSVNGGPSMSGDNDAAMDNSGAGMSNTNTASAPSSDGGNHMMSSDSGMHHKHHGMGGVADVEGRIKTLHAKLKITPDQESAFDNFAQAMRDSESQKDEMIKERHQNNGKMTAVDDLQSYQKVVQAHADGIAKVSAAFSPLYNSMSDSQKANADQVFGEYGNRMHEKHKMMHHHHHTGSSTSPSDTTAQ